jgi:hypothetical protein
MSASAAVEVAVPKVIQLPNQGLAAAERGEQRDKAHSYLLGCTTTAAGGPRLHARFTMICIGALTCFASGWLLGSWPWLDRQRVVVQASVVLAAAVAHGLFLAAIFVGSR